MAMIISSGAAPAPLPTRTKPAELRREELMDAAQILFVRSGVARTSIDEIVNAAGVSKGGFYHHFASKDELLAAIQDRFVAGFLEVIVAAQAVIDPDDWFGRVNAVVAASVREFFAKLALHDVVFHEYRAADRREMNENIVVDYFQAFLCEGHEKGAWSVSRPRLTAIMLFHALHGACDEAVLTPGKLAEKDVVEALQQFFRRVLDGGTASKLETAAPPAETG
jgi:AcrR family transcriptional regulator